MVVYREYLKCDVCEAITAVRTQIGYLDQHPIRIHCGRCGTLFDGLIVIDQKRGNYSLTFHNASQVRGKTLPKPDFIIESSGELLTDKLQVYKDDESFACYTPFFKTLAEIDRFEMSAFIDYTQKFLEFRKNRWPRIRRIHDIWIDEKHEYLAKELREYLHEKTFPLDNELEYLRGVNIITLSVFFDLLNKERFSSNSKFVMDEISQLANTNLTNLMKLVNYFEANRLIYKYESKLLKQLNRFVVIFPHLIPVFGLQFYKQIPRDLSVKKGLTTVSIEDLKQFYVDTYETLAETIDLIVSFNNLKHRGDFEKMANRRRDIKTMSDFIVKIKSKGIKIDFIDGSEAFDKLIDKMLNNKIRNAIGHNSYKFDGISQLIKFYPKGLQDESDVEEMYLLDFARCCWNLFLCIVDLYTLVYQTRKIFLVISGYSSIDPKLIDEHGIFKY
ncbi:MAG: hypothetical protein M0Q13_13355 [Methanothrix sp.]|jgi:hypothetical protein|nr:hypothetical protein [Methanothrix sp.]